MQDGIGQPDPLWTVKGLLRAGADAIQMVAPAEGKPDQHFAYTYHTLVTAFDEAFSVATAGIALRLLVSSLHAGEAVNMGPLLDLVREADEHAAAAALVEVAVAPDLASCAAAGLNYTHRQVRTGHALVYRLRDCILPVLAPVLTMPADGQL